MFGRTVLVQTTAGETVRIQRTVLTSDSISGILKASSERVAEGLGNVGTFSYRSRGRGVWDWMRLGAIAGAVATPLLLERECSGCGAYALLLGPVGAATGAVYGVIIGSVIGSTIRFEIVPQR